MACSPFSILFVKASRNGDDRMTSGPSAAYSSRMSTIRTSASGRSSTRFLERDELVASVLRVVVALQRRRRRPEDHEGACGTTAHHGHVAAVVARTLFLFIGPVVLFVHDDQSEIRQRREDRAARADDDVDIAAADALPLIVALAVGEPAVLDRHPLAERGAEDRRRLRRQRDLGNHEQHALARLAHRARQAQVDLGLAAAGHAV